MSETVRGPGDTMANKTDTDLSFINKSPTVSSFADKEGPRGQTKDKQTHDGG